MKQLAGVWINRKKAVVVSVTDAGRITTLITPGAERHSYGAGCPPREQGARGARTRESRRFMSRLDRYYDQIISMIHEADSILLFGSGKESGEIRKRIEKTDLQGRVRVVETEGQITDPRL